MNRQTFSRLWRLVKPFFVSEVKWQARSLLVLLIVFALATVGMSFLISYVARDFINYLELKEQSEFFRQLFVYLGAFALSTIIAVFQSYTEQRTALLWRMTLSRQILQKYFTNLAYYRISFFEGIDNPDQRLEEDIRTFTTATLSLFLISCNSLLTLVLFVGILWSISLNLIAAVVVYAFLGSVITFLIGRPLIGLNFAQLKKEADYRYKLVNVRDNAESIAFYRGDRKELTRTRQRLKVALANFLRIIKVNRNLNFFIVFYNNLKPVLPIIIVAPLYLSGEIKWGVIWQSADAFVRVVEALSILIANFGTISNIAAVVTRLGSFNEALEAAGREDAGTSPELPTIETVIEPRVAFQKLTVMTPKGDQTLVRELSLELKSGGLLICGGSGNGKTSLLRAIGGLWKTGEGTIVRPELRECFFLPQRPYLVLGSLRNQLLYSVKRRGISDRELKSALERVGLESALERVKGLSAVANWNSLLSAGEQQQLAFARLILARPKFAFLDEATTAVDTAAEAMLYEMLTNTTTAFVSVGYRANLSRYHRMILQVNDDGSWYLERVPRGK
ncbi:MAG: ABC transporter ATP-binding protein/permease [Bdellovibrionota bacterium]